MAKVQLQEKGMAILVEKAACFESNNYKDISTKELKHCYSGMTFQRRR
jgi:hypothetical protein